MASARVRSLPRSSRGSSISQPIRPLGSRAPPGRPPAPARLRASQGPLRSAEQSREAAIYFVATSATPDSQRLKKDSKLKEKLDKPDRKEEEEI